MKACICLLPLVAALVIVPSTASAQQPFASQEAAADALVTALGMEKADADRLARVLGPDWATYIPAGSVDRDDVDAFLARYKERHAFEPGPEGRTFLVVGNEPWTLPVPIVRTDAGWTFDLKAGEQEIRERRIGRNELDAEQAALAYHDAQMDYAAIDRDGDGVLEYAQKFLSSDGEHDGLYWAEEPGMEESPLGPLFGDETPDGEWHGYHYRILTAQGPSAPRGAYDYMLGDNMNRGFALVAWPAKYADSGVMSFMISHDGAVFEKDLGADGAQVAKAMTRFDPDSSWKEIETPGTAAR
jgi:hypothetical protein